MFVVEMRFSFSRIDFNFSTVVQPPDYLASVSAAADNDDDDDDDDDDNDDIHVSCTAHSTRQWRHKANELQCNPIVPTTFKCLGHLAVYYRHQLLMTRQWDTQTKAQTSREKYKGIKDGGEHRSI